MKAIPTGQTLGARVEGLSLAAPLSADARDQVIALLGRHGVLEFPQQELTTRELRDFSAHFGALEINVAASHQEPGLPEVMTLSNIVENGQAIGLADAGQGWHTDMSYSRMIAFTNILYGIEIPVRDGQPLGATEFCNMHAAYDDLPQDVKALLADKTAEHDFEKFWDWMRRERGSARPALTAAQRAARPPVSHPVFLTHPITGRKVLYCNPGYAMRINELPTKQSTELLDYLFAHQLQDKYRYAFRWSPRSVLMWDNMGTIHNAVADYAPHERRLIKRCQVAATRFFEAA